MKSTLASAIFVSIPLCFGFGQEQPDAALLAEIMKIKAVDNHTHVPRVDLAGENDEEYDALPCETYVEPTADNVMTRQDNPEYVAACFKGTHTGALRGFNSENTQHPVLDSQSSRDNIIAQYGTGS